jgi:hypothetical protein
MNNEKCQYCEKLSVHRSGFLGSCCMWDYFETDDLSTISDIEKENLLLSFDPDHYIHKLRTIIEKYEEKIDEHSNTYSTFIESRLEFFQSFEKQFNLKKTLSDKQISLIEKEYNKF